MKKYICEVCGWVYDEESCKENGIPLVEFEDLPDDFVCPVCGVGKELFSEIEEDINETQEKTIILLLTIALTLFSSIVFLPSAVSEANSAPRERKATIQAGLSSRPKT